MLDAAKIGKQTRQLEKLMAAGFGATKGPLEKRLAKAGRRLPAAVHKDVAAVSEAAFLAGHPKLGRVLAQGAVDAAYDRAVEALRKVDPKERRKALLLSTAGMVAFNLIVVAAVLIWVLWYRGYLG